MAYYIVLSNEESLPARVAAALNDYYKRFGPPPPMCESIEIEVDGDVVVVGNFSMKETE